MGSSFSVLRVENSSSRWENIQKEICQLPGEYIYFSSGHEKVEPDRIRKMLAGIPSSADLIVPVSHTDSPNSERLEEPLLLPQHLLFERFRCAPLLNGKLMKRSFLLKYLENNLYDWIHAPCPDLFLLLFSSAQTAFARTDYRYDRETFHWFASGCRKAVAWLENLSSLPDEEKKLLRSRMLHYEDHLIDFAADLRFSGEEVASWFDRTVLIRNYYTWRRECLSSVKLPPPSGPRGPIRNLAIFCWALRIGGAERCASLLLNFFSSFPDLKIYLFQSSKPMSGDYPYPKNVEVIVLPNQPFLRQVYARDALYERKIDTCIFFDHILPVFYYDILTASQLGIRTVAMVHNSFSSFLYSGVPELLALRKAVLPSADMVTCLSRSDEYFWNQMGIHARYMPNPLTFDTSARPPFSERKNKTLIFIARQTPEKGVLDALKTVEIVRQKHPEVKLFLLGKFSDPAFEREMHNYVENHHMTGNVQFTGFAKVEDYLSQAAIHLMPSCVEGYPMTLMEAKSCGVPTVAYSLPYLEAGKAEYGTIMVPQGDYRAMAEKVSELFDDFGRLNDLGRKAYDSVRHFDNEYVISRWKQLFQYLETGVEPEDFAPPHIPIEMALEFQKIHTREILIGAAAMHASPAFRKKIFDHGVAAERHKNILFDLLMRLYFILRGKMGNSFYSQVVFRIFFSSLWRIKRIYRRFRPWTDEEQEL